PSKLPQLMTNLGSPFLVKGRGSGGQVLFFSYPSLEGRGWGLGSASVPCVILSEVEGSPRSDALSFLSALTRSLSAIVPLPTWEGLGVRFQRTASKNNFGDRLG